MDDRLKAAAMHWSIQRASDRTRWWMHPSILRHINRLVCGEQVDGAHAGFNRLIQARAPEGGFRRAVSIGCGAGGKEMKLLQQGIVQQFDLFEISEFRIGQIQDRAAERGVLDRIRWHHADAFEQEPEGSFDLVYWNNSLHHMFDVRQALAWSHRALTRGGYLVMDDFVGATRFQWTDLELEMASRVRALLPDSFLRNPKKPAAQLPRVLGRSDLQEMIKDDPSEAADSSNILPAIAALFPDAIVIPTGGVIYHLALNDVLANFDDDRDATLLESLLLLDETLARNGHSQYAVAIALKA